MRSFHRTCPHLRSAQRKNALAVGTALSLSSSARINHAPLKLAFWPPFWYHWISVLKSSCRDVPNLAFQKLPSHHSSSNYCRSFYFLFLFIFYSLLQKTNLKVGCNSTKEHFCSKCKIPSTIKRVSRDFNSIFPLSWEVCVIVNQGRTLDSSTWTLNIEAQPMLVYPKSVGSPGGRGKKEEENCAAKGKGGNWEGPESSSRLSSGFYKQNKQGVYAHPLWLFRSGHSQEEWEELEGDSDRGSEVAEEDYGFPGSYKQPLAELVKAQPIPTPASQCPQIWTASAQGNPQSIPIHLSSLRPFWNSGSPVLVTQLKSLREF